MQAADLMNTSQALAPALRKTVRGLAVCGLEASGRLRLAKRRIAAQKDLVVLTLHRVVPDDELSMCRSPHGMVLRESLFVKLLDYLKATATLISPDEAFTAPSIASRPRVLLTFDDGWADNYEVALPHLSKSDVRAHFFAVTSLVGNWTPFWPERMLLLLARVNETKQFGILNDLLDVLQADSQQAHPLVHGSDGYEELLVWLKKFPNAAISQWMQEAVNHLDKVSQATYDFGRPPDPRERLMTWEQLQGLIDAGHGVGSHTCTHAILPQLNSEHLARELRDSHYALTRHLCLRDSVPLWISYPNGSASSAIAVAAHDARYRYGFINTPGLWQERSDPLLIPRVNVWDGTLVDKNGVFCERQLEYALFWKAHHAAIQS